YAALARDAYRASLAIRETLARRDPGNATWQRDLIVSLVKTSMSSPADARAALIRALAIARELAAAGKLAPTDSGMPNLIAARLAALPPEPGAPPHPP
ncbi:MAG: hypothetical protein ACP5NP_07845, partial [Acetobacteraceae bacterium]